MADATQSAENGDEVFSLTYRSESLIADENRVEELGAIFTTARRHNRELGVTGALMITDQAFVQTLEGEESVVRELFAQIRDDARHEGVAVVRETFGPRVFGRWAMAKAAADGGPDIRLLSNAQRGSIVAAPREHGITAAQEESLAFMRESLTHDTMGT